MDSETNKHKSPQNIFIHTWSVFLTVSVYEFYSLHNSEFDNPISKKLWKK